MDQLKLRRFEGTSATIVGRECARVAVHQDTNEPHAPAEAVGALPFSSSLQIGFRSFSLSSATLTDFVEI